jgi:transcriptional regulator with XRE-family HTH domain
MKDFELIKRLRLARGWTAAEAADKLKITPQHLSRIENGKQKPTKILLETMVSLYDIPQEDAELLRRRAGMAEEGPPELSQAGSSQSNMQPDQVSMIKVDALKTPVLYTNALFVSSDDYGITIDAGSRVGPSNEIQIVSRIGFSLEHAVRIREALDIHIKKLKERVEN